VIPPVINSAFFRLLAAALHKRRVDFANRCSRSLRGRTCKAMLPPPIRTYRQVGVLYLVIFLALFGPFILRGEVVAPTDQSEEMASAHVSRPGAPLQNNKFSDYAQVFIPEISEHLRGARSGWLALWTDKTELGRPLYHLSGFSPAYPPSWLLSQLTGDPWRFITILSLTTCFLSGLFVILFCGEQRLAPLAGLVAGTSLAASPLFMYWLTFPMFPAVWCWSAGALWALTRLARKVDLLGWSALAFSGYSLLMTAYPQLVVFSAYLLGGYTVALASRAAAGAFRDAIWLLVAIGSALTVGALLAAPVYWDLAVIASESGRVSPDPSFFTAVLPKISNASELFRYIVVGFAPQTFGNPIDPKFPLPYDGLSVTPIVIFFAVVGAALALRRTWGWWLAIAVFCAFAFVTPLYLVGVKYLGFNLSRSNPLACITLPLTVIMAYGADALAARADPLRATRVVVAACVVVGLATAAAIAYGLMYGAPVHWQMTLDIALLLAMLAMEARAPRRWAVVLALTLTLATISFPQILRQPRASIATSSPLTERLRAVLPEGSRYAVASPGVNVLSPNLNAELGLPSVHAYDSLSSRRYHALVRALGGEAQTYGRHNLTIAPNTASPAFWMSDVGLMLSPNPLADPKLQDLGEEASVRLYGVGSHMGESWQAIVSQAIPTNDELQIPDPRSLPSRPSVKRIDQGDAREFDVTPGAGSVLILSQIYHRDWRSQVLADGVWRPARTVAINGVLQGVLLPPDAQRVRLEFRPFARYAFIAHVFWLFLLGCLIVRAWRARRGGSAVDA
jgi:hypothetical protein